MSLQYTGLILASSPETSVIQPFTERCCRPKRKNKPQQAAVIVHRFAAGLFAQKMEIPEQFQYSSVNKVTAALTGTFCHLPLQKDCLSHPVSEVGTLSSGVTLLKSKRDRSPPLSAEV
jgi:hypothetical protein